MSHLLLETLRLLLNALFDLAWFIIVAAVIASWLVAFGVLNMRNDLVRQVMRILDGLTEPLFRPVRRLVPPIGGLDLSPVIVLIGIVVLQYFLNGLINLLEAPV
jgi:YggT family protein